MPRFFRVQPNGLSLFGHRSKLGAEPVVGVFAFEHPDTLFGTYSWIHISKRLPGYEMIEFDGVLLERPSDSEGVVVEPLREICRTPMVEWLPKNGYLAIVSR
jgi:hypothetical protein